MDMWNWLLDCYIEKSLTIEEMENIDDEKADRLWKEFSSDHDNFTEYVKDEVKNFLRYVIDKKVKTNDN